MLDEDTTIFNEGVVLRFPQRPNHRALTLALEQILQLHEGLRSSFHVDDEAYVEIHSHARFVLDTVELGDRPDGAAVRAALDVPFDLSVGTLFRAVLFLTAPDEATLLLMAHHIVVDRESFIILIRDLARAYNAILSGAAVDFRRVSVSDASLGQTRRTFERTEDFLEGIAYWKHRLKGARPPQVGEMSEAHAAVANIELGKNLSEGLLTLARARRTTPFMLLLAVSAIYLHLREGRDDVILGYPISERDDETDNIIGPLFNLLPFRIVLSSGDTFRSVMDKAQCLLFSDFEYREVPFNTLVGAVEDRGGRLKHPLFDVMVSFHDSRNETFRFGDMTIALGDPCRAAPKYTIEFEWELKRDNFRCKVVHRPPSEEQGAGLQACVSSIVHSMIDRPDSAIDVATTV